MGLEQEFTTEGNSKKTMLAREASLSVKQNLSQVVVKKTSDCHRLSFGVRDVNRYAGIFSTLVPIPVKESELFL